MICCWQGKKTDAWQHKIKGRIYRDAVPYGSGGGQRGGRFYRFISESIEMVLTNVKVAIEEGARISEPDSFAY